MTLLSDAMEVTHRSRLKSAAGEEFTYRRNAVEATVTGIPALSVFVDQTSPMEAEIQTKLVDVLISPEDLKIGGEHIEPAKGDQLVNRHGETFDVYSGENGSCWDWTDGHKTFFRIHTMRRSAERVQSY